MIAISNLKLAPGADEAQLRTLAAGALKVQPQDITGLRIRKKSLDAQKRRYSLCLHRRRDRARG